MNKAVLIDADYTYALPDHWVLHTHNQGQPFEVLNRAYVARVIELIKASGAKTVLEVGCGDGWNCAQMSDAGLDVVGIDWSKNAIGYASLLVPSARFMKADVVDPQFLTQFPSKFDAIAFIEVLEHIQPKDCVEALRNITAPLKSGGILVITTPHENFPNDNPQHYQHFTEQKVRDLVAKAGGLKIETIEGYGDVTASDRLWRKARWVNNRLFTIKPMMDRLLKEYAAQQLTTTPFNKCHGIVASLRKL